MGAKQKYVFTEDQMKQARKMRSEGASFRAIAETFGGSAPMWHGRLDPDAKKKQQEYYTKNRDRQIAASRERYWKDPEAKTIADRMRKYGISKEHAIKLQSVSHCEICGVELTKSVGNDGRVIDHCHETKKVRGVLCNRCNRGLGFFQDNQEIIQQALLYIEKHKG